MWTSSCATAPSAVACRSCSLRRRLRPIAAAPMPVTMPATAGATTAVQAAHTPSAASDQTAPIAGLESVSRRRRRRRSSLLRRRCRLCLRRRL
eukprot:4247499-Prymnesium_polylepis.1